MNVIQIRWKTLLKLARLFAVLLTICLVLYFLFRSREASLKYDHAKRRFYINRPGERLSHLQIKSVSIVYAKLCMDDWLSALENALQLGANTIQIDIPWNAHEPAQKRYDFESHSNDLATFIELVHARDLYLIVRIDPYIQCSAHDFGGLPSWLLGDEDLTDRENNYAINNNDGGGGLLNLNDNKFLEAFQDYLDRLLPVLGKYQLGNANGPIIGVLTQRFDPRAHPLNSLASFYNEDYVEFLRDSLDYSGFFEAMLNLKNACDVGQHSHAEDLHRYCDFNLKFYEPMDERRAKQSTVTFKTRTTSDLELNCLGLCDKIKKIFFSLN